MHAHAVDLPLLPPAASTSVSPPFMGAAELRHHPISSSLSVQPPHRDGDNSFLFSAGKKSNPSHLTAAVDTQLQPAPFLAKTYDIVNDKETDAVISWNPNGDGFVVWDSKTLGQNLLPRYFKHSNFASFVRQLNTYGFRKVDSERWEFVNHAFVRGQKHLIRCIRREKPSMIGPLHHENPQPPCIVWSSSSSMLTCDSEIILDPGKFDFRAELNALKREAYNLRKRIQHAERMRKQAIWQRIQDSNNREHIMMTFVTKAMRDPTFVTQLVRGTSRETIEEPKRQRLMVPLTDSFESKSRQVQVNRVYRMCDTPRRDEQQASNSTTGLATMQTKRSVEMEVESRREIQLDPYTPRAQNGGGCKQASQLMAIDNENSDCWSAN